MMMPRMHPPTKLWDLFRKMPLKHFYNLRLGEPFRPPGGSVDEDVFLENAYGESVLPLEPSAKQDGRYYMAYDQGNDLYVLIGKFLDGRIRIVRAEIIPFEQRDGWNRIRELYNIYQPVMTVGDAHPNRHPARDLTESLPKGRAYMAFYSESQKEYTINKTELLVNINRTEMLDRVRDSIHAGGVLLSGRRHPRLPQMSHVIDHCLNMERDEEVRHTPSGDKIVGVWRKTGPDHFFHTLGYLLIAHEMKPSGIVRFNIIGKAAPRRSKEYKEALEKQVVWKTLR